MMAATVPPPGTAPVAEALQLLAVLTDPDAVKARLLEIARATERLTEREGKLVALEAEVTAVLTAREADLVNREADFAASQAQQRREDAERSATLEAAYAAREAALDKRESDFAAREAEVNSRWAKIHAMRVDLGIATQETA
jgi:hypothetical protein